MSDNKTTKIQQIESLIKERNRLKNIISNLDISKLDKKNISPDKDFKLKHYEGADYDGSSNYTYFHLFPNVINNEYKIIFEELLEAYNRAALKIKIIIAEVDVEINNLLK